MKHLSRAICMPLFARARNAACRARSFIPTERTLQDRASRANAPGWSSNRERSGIELAERAIDPPTARAIVGYRASSRILVIHDPDLSKRIDPLENSISICLLVQSIFVLRIRIHLLNGVAKKTDCTSCLFYTRSNSVCPSSSGSSKIKIKIFFVCRVQLWEEVWEETRLLLLHCSQSHRN